jgi:hypothetical protein
VTGKVPPSAFTEKIDFFTPAAVYGGSIFSAVPVKYLS